MRFFHKHLRRLLLFFLKRHPSLALDVLRHHPSLALDALRQQNSLSFANCPDRQQRNFEDLDWLLVSNLTNRGLLRLAFDEAAFLFRLVRSQPAAQILEIGRYHGGSAFLFAVASDHNSMVTSIDIAPQNDELLQIALKKSGLAYKVQLLLGDSNRGEARVDFYNLIFVDGDHSYEGVLKDYEKLLLSVLTVWRLSVWLEMQTRLAHHSLKSPACSCISITLPFSKLLVPSMAYPQPWILAGERSGLLTRIAATESPGHTWAR